MPYKVRDRFGSSCTNFSRFQHKIYTLCAKIFYKLSMIMKNIFDGWFKSKALHVPWPMLSFIKACSTRKFSIFLFTQIMLSEFTHVIFAKIMVSVICSMLPIPYHFHLIFLRCNIHTPLHQLHFQVVVMQQSPTSNLHAFYSFIKHRCLMNWMDRQGF